LFTVAVPSPSPYGEHCSVAGNLHNLSSLWISSLAACCAVSHFAVRLCGNGLPHLQSGREGALKLTQVVEMSEAKFIKRFPEYSQWKTWLNGEEQVGDRAGVVGGCVGFVGCCTQGGGGMDKQQGGISWSTPMAQTWLKEGQVGEGLVSAPAHKVGLAARGHAS
jgi:hypothetical protein